MTEALRIAFDNRHRHYYPTLHFAKSALEICFTMGIDVYGLEWTTDDQELKLMPSELVLSEPDTYYAVDHNTSPEVFYFNHKYAVTTKEDAWATVVKYKVFSNGMTAGRTLYWVHFLLGKARVSRAIFANKIKKNNF